MTIGAVSPAEAETISIRTGIPASAIVLVPLGV